MTDEPLLVSEEFILVVDTNAFAGNFAEELCAYVTGFYGEDVRHDVRSVSDLFYRDHEIEDDESHKGLLAEEKNPFHGYVIDHMNEDGDYTPWAVWPSRKYGVNASGDYAELTEGNYDDYNFPAGFSVGVYFAESPPADLLDKFKERTKKFFADIYPRLAKEGREKDVKVEGFRLITHRKTAQDVAI